MVVLVVEYRMSPQYQEVAAGILLFYMRMPHLRTEVLVHVYRIGPSSYEEIERVMDKLPTSYMNILLGYFNAKVGQMHLHYRNKYITKCKFNLPCGI